MNRRIPLRKPKLRASAICVTRVRIPVRCASYSRMYSWMCVYTYARARAGTFRAAARRSEIASATNYRNLRRISRDVHFWGLDPGSDCIITSRRLPRVRSGDPSARRRARGRHSPNPRVCVRRFQRGKFISRLIEYRRDAFREVLRLIRKPGMHAAMHLQPRPFPTRWSVRTLFYMCI